ncbi:fluoride efflux transporter FluC [Sphingosinicella terrae]|jgi:fluoride exporter|uniref:fluoride efflux transporter FluC n=1 Tax=Sphingosinicella terrae TaxID=2172047 RepID=UPI000E0D1DBC|nr:CrcB family protein [Sphingosinicella terrae]
MRSDARAYLAVAAGGALGSIARHAVSLAAASLLGPAFPWGTLAVNMIGSFLIGFAFRALGPGEGGRVFLLAGFCGGFTTFSLLSLETLDLADRSSLLAVIYAGGSVLIALGAVWLGHRLGARLEPVRGS